MACLSPKNCKLKITLIIFCLSLLSFPLLASATTVFITSGTSWTVPSDWTNTNTIEVIGGEGGG